MEVPGTKRSNRVAVTGQAYSRGVSAPTAMARVCRRVIIHTSSHTVTQQHTAVTALVTKRLPVKVLWKARKGASSHSTPIPR